MYVLQKILLFRQIFVNAFMSLAISIIRSYQSNDFGFVFFHFSTPTVWWNFRYMLLDLTHTFTFWWIPIPDFPLY
jgi:hypothetical protein